jgi:cytochrome c peroxidase
MIPRTLAGLVAAIVFTLVPFAGAQAHGADDHGLKAATDLALDALPPLPADPSNRWADNPEAAALGERLFFDARLSSNGRVSCGTCHDPKRGFQDSVPLGKGVGTAGRRTMPIAGTAYSPFLFWDGRKDSLWSQALGPLESPVEHGGNRAQYAKVIARHYRGDYERLFGSIPDLRKRDGQTAVFVNIGKAIAAYERTLQPQPARFDRFVAEWKKTGVMPQGTLDAKERAGFALFVGKAECANCHNGPLFTNNEFHNTGVPARPGKAPDKGRIVAVAAVKADEFNCRSRWSDAKPGECAELDFLPPADATHAGAFRVPSLRNVAERAPYMHAGQVKSLREVLSHYNRAPKAAAGRTELHPLALDKVELEQLEAFLRTLSEGT